MKAEAAACTDPLISSDSSFHMLSTATRGGNATLPPLVPNICLHNGVNSREIVSYHVLDDKKVQLTEEVNAKVTLCVAQAGVLAQLPEMDPTLVRCKKCCSWEDNKKC